MENAVRKLGAYYTPRSLAEPLVRWAVRGPADRVLDPSCGQGVFLAESVGRLLDLGAAPERLPDLIAGVELDPSALARANGLLLSRHPSLRWGRLAEEDFFSFTARHRGRVEFDVVVGNPPFLRTQGRKPAEKRFALDVCRTVGLELTGEASSWAPFVGCAAGFVRPGGRLAMVIPREALFVRYAKPLFAWLRDRFRDVQVVVLDGLHFDALEKVAILLCEGSGPGSLTFSETPSLETLTLRPSATPLRSWRSSRVPEDCRSAVEEALASPALVPLSHLATVSLGIVTGDKGFFLLDEGSTAVPPRYLHPVVAKPRYISGCLFQPWDLEEAAPRSLLTIPPEYTGGSLPLDEYLAEGEARGVPSAYKCRTRKPWYAVRRVGAPPDAFLGYLVKRRLRCAVNLAQAQSTNNVHRLYFRPELRARAPELVASWYNPVTLLSLELSGRVYAGGVLKIEPSEAGDLLIPDSRLVHHVPVRELDRALRRGDEARVGRFLDRWSSRVLRLSEKTLCRVRAAWGRLRETRLGGSARPMAR